MGKIAKKCWSKTYEKSSESCRIDRKEGNIRVCLDFGGDVVEIYLERTISATITMAKC